MMIDSVDESGLLRTWMNETWHLTIHRAYDYVWLPPNTPDDGREKCLIQIRNDRAGGRGNDNEESENLFFDLYFSQ